jgi:hypothetical protein
MAPRPVLLAVIGGLAVNLAACASSHRSTTDNPSPCPRGSPYRPGVSGIGEYVDFLRFDGRTYFGRSASISASQLGPVVARVRCSLTAADDPSRTPPQIIDGTASFLRAGTPVYAVRGYSPTCRLAAYLNGQLQAYLAQAEHGRAAPTTRPCALSPTRPVTSPT